MCLSSNRSQIRQKPINENAHRSLILCAFSLVVGWAIISPTSHHCITSPVTPLSSCFNVVVYLYKQLNCLAPPLVLPWSRYMPPMSINYFKVLYIIIIIDLL